MESPEISSGNETVSSIKQKFEQISSSSNISSPFTFQESPKYQLSKHRTPLSKYSSEIKLPSVNDEPKRSMSSSDLNDKSEQDQIWTERARVKDIIVQYEKSTSKLRKENVISPVAVKYDSKHDKSHQRRSLSNSLDFNMEDSERFNGYNGSNQEYDYKTEVHQTDDIRRLTVKVTVLERKVEDLLQTVSSLKDTIANLELRKAFNGENKEVGEKPMIIKRTPKLVNFEDN